MFFNFNNIMKVSAPKVDTLKKDGSNVCDFFTADVLGAQRFAQNYGGYPRSDIALINEQTNMEVAQNLLSSLPDFRSDVDMNKGLSDIEILMAHRSKYIQSPSESIAFIESQLEYRDTQRAAAEFKPVVDGQSESTEQPTAE